MRCNNNTSIVSPKRQQFEPPNGAIFYPRLELRRRRPAAERATPSRLLLLSQSSWTHVESAKKSLRAGDTNEEEHWAEELAHSRRSIKLCSELALRNGERARDQGSLAHHQSDRRLKVASLAPPSNCRTASPEDCWLRARQMCGSRRITPASKTRRRRRPAAVVHAARAFVRARAPRALQPLTIVVASPPAGRRPPSTLDDGQCRPGASASRWTTTGRPFEAIGQYGNRSSTQQPGDAPTLTVSGGDGHGDQPAVIVARLFINRMGIAEQSSARDR